jgi:hypothetical protein
MKRISTFIIAIALLLGLSQCKKQETPNTTETDGKLVHISVNVNHGSKHIVNPGGTYSFENGDKLYVGNNGRYIGTLEYQSGVFSGDIYEPSTTDYLHFYFVGGLEPSVTPVTAAGGATPTTNFTVNISNQATKLPVLSYGHSSQNYTTATATYSCRLDNKCALVKFVPSEGTSDPITISGMKTTAAINFSTPGITPIVTPGNITLYSASETEKWAVLLEQDAVSSSIVTINGTVAAMASVPAIANNNMYSSTGVSITRSAVIEINDSNRDAALSSFNNKATENPILRLTGNINWSHYSGGSDHAVTRKNGIIDFNWHTATNMFLQNNVQGESITLMNGTIHESNEIGIDGNNGWSDLYHGTVILENMTIENNKIFTDGHEYIIRSGTYYGICNATKTGYPGTVIIYGGYFGEFYNGEESYCINGIYELYGGKYKFNPTTTGYNVTIPSGYSVKSNPDSDSGIYPWIVTKD